MPRPRVPIRPRRIFPGDGVTWLRNLLRRTHFSECLSFPRATLSIWRTGNRIARLLSVIARPFACRVHQVSQVEN